MKSKLVKMKLLQPGDIVETLDRKAVMVIDVQNKTVFAPMGSYPSTEVTLSNGIVFAAYQWMLVPILP
jgi:hypothetical protein